MKMVSKTVIFDMDGVIFDTEKLTLDCWCEIAKQEGIEDIADFYPKCIGSNAKQTKELFEDKYGNDFYYEGFVKKAMDLFFSYVDKNGMPMKPGVLEILNYLKDNNFKIGLASSTGQEAVIPQLASRDLLSFFQVIICGNMVSKSKPAPDIFLKACHDIGEAPEHTYAIEDSYHGIHAAYAAGMKAIMVPDLIQPDEEIKRIAYRIFPSLQEVKQFIKEETEIGYRTGSGE